MNVMKNDFLPKQKRLQSRSQKQSKSGFLGYHTVSSGPPLPFHKILFGNANDTRSPNSVSDISDSFDESTSRSEITNQKSTDEEISPILPETNEVRKLFHDEEDRFSDVEMPKHFKSDSTDEDISTEFEQLLESFHSAGQFSTSDNTHFPSNSTQIFPEENPDDFKYELSAPVTHKFMNLSPGPRTIGASASRDAVDESDNVFLKYFSHGESSSQDVTVDFTDAASPFLKIPERHNRTSSSSKTPSHSSSSTRTRTPLFSRTPTSKTAKSPKSGSGMITSSDSDSESYVLAVTEGRGHARGEVGIAAMDPRRPHLTLSQISDNQRYVHTLTKMHVFSIKEVIIPNTFTEGSSPSKLYLDIREHFPRMAITSVQRRHFSETAGLEWIKQYSSSESESVMVLLKDKFYALSAATALMKYLEFTQNVLFPPRSVKVEYQGTEDTMIIDLDTANRLELVLTRTNLESDFRNTLLGVLNHCHTKGGVRLLRANILQPPCLLTKIETRLDCVTELIGKPLVFFAIESAVTSFANVESLLTLCMHEPKQDGLRAAEFQLKYVLLLKSTLELLPVLRSSLDEATSDYFCEVRENLGDERYKIILNRILEVVPENAKTGKASAAINLHACFTIKTGVNGLLDVAKKTYCEIVQEIWDHVNSLREKHGMHLRMSFSGKRGFHIQYTPEPGERHIKPITLPKDFILVQKTKSTFYFYTSELVALDQRSQEVLNEVKMITNVVLFELLNDIRQHIGCLFNLCEYVAELDVITSFAHSGSGQNYVRPRFGDVLDVTEARHPILDVIHDGQIVANDIFAEKDRNCVILTGPNQSGKSIYIGQVALLQVMAQVGCYVPAKTATFRMTDRIFSRLGFDDSIESNASTLIAEMRDMEYLRQNITNNSLIIIDEPCKGTSVDEGTALAFAICEEFLDSTAFIYLTTHYIFLTKLEELYYNVSNYHFESELVGLEDGKFSLRFTHKKAPGVTKAVQYGMQIAELTSFPSDVLAKAREISQQLLLERKPPPEVSGLSGLYKIAQELKAELSAHGPDTPSSELAATILRFKTMLLNLNPSSDCYDLNGNEMEEGTTACEGTEVVRPSPVADGAMMTFPGPEPESGDQIVQPEETAPAQSNRGGLKKVIWGTAKRIRRKYRKLMMHRVYYQAFRSEFWSKRALRSTSGGESFFSENFMHSVNEPTDRKSDANFLFGLK